MGRLCLQWIIPGSMPPLTMVSRHVRTCKDTLLYIVNVSHNTHTTQFRCGSQRCSSVPNNSLRCRDDFPRHTEKQIHCYCQHHFLSRGEHGMKIQGSSEILFCINVRERHHIRTYIHLYTYMYVYA